MAKDIDPIENGPFVEDYLLYMLARASAVVSREFHEVVKENGLSIPEWRVLACLADRDRAVGPLAELTLLQQSTLSKLLDRMMAEGYLRRRAVTTKDKVTDKRVVMVTLTDAGRAAVADLQAAAHRHEAAILSDYETEDIVRFKAMLNDLIARHTLNRG